MINRWLAAIAAGACALTFGTTAAAQAASTPYFVDAGLGSLPYGLFQSAAAPLPDGDVLVAGGSDFDGFQHAQAWRFDSTTNSFTSVGSMSAPRTAAVAAPLPNGDVLVAGGGNGNGFLNTAELFDPTTNTFNPLSSHLTDARVGAVAAPLPDGDVLIAGGSDSVNPNTLLPNYLSTAEIFDPATDTFTATNSMSAPRGDAAAAPLPNGDVLIAGGSDGPSTNDPQAPDAVSSAVLFDPATDTFTPTGSLNVPRTGARAVALPDGDVLVIGGVIAGVGTQSSAELYNPATGTFSLVAAPLPSALSEPVAVALPDGRALIAGGQTSSGAPSAGAEEYVPAAEAATAGGQFGDQTVSEPSAVQQLVVSNLGAQGLAITGASITGANATDFAIADDACANRTLGYGQTCTIGVRFTPTTASAESATLTLADNEATPGTVALTGTGVAPTAGPPGAQGPQGPQGPQGTQGTQGAQGPAGVVVCRNTAAAQLLCSLIFAPGSYKMQSSARELMFQIRRGGRTVVHGMLRMGHGALTIRPLRALRRGRYTLTVTSGHGRQADVLVDRTFTVG